MNPLRSLDDRLLFAVNSFARNTPALHGAMLAYATYGVGLFGLLLLTALIAARHRSSRDLATTGWAAVAMLLGLAVNQPLGHLFAEQRPYVTHPALLRLTNVTADFSFPSDHAVMAGAVAAGLLLAHRRLGALATIAALLMAFARVYVGAHYPWDVLGGLLLGASISLLGWFVLRPALMSLTRWLRHRPGMRTGFGERHSEAPAVHGPHNGLSDRAAPHIY